MTTWTQLAGSEIGRWAISATLVAGAHVGLVAHLAASAPFSAEGDYGAVVIEIADAPSMRLIDETPEGLLRRQAALAVAQQPSATAPTISPAMPQKAVPDEPTRETSADNPSRAAAPPTPQAAAPASIASSGDDSATAPKGNAEQTGPQARDRHIGTSKTVDPRALAKWQSAFSRLFERNKRYPADAGKRRLKGIVQVRFSIDRSGRLVASSIAASSGHDLLDRAALDLLKRSDPFPPPPDGLTTDVVELTAPIRFVAP